MNATEHTYRQEGDARKSRRAFIASGVAVSLLAYDGARDVYAFDTYAG